MESDPPENDAKLEVAVNSHFSEAFSGDRDGGC